jgi:spermidine synthase
VGLLQAANIAGCTAGSLLVGLVLFAALGTAGSLRLLLACGVVFAVVGLRHYGRRFALPAAALVLLATVLPGQERLWRRLHGVTPSVPLALFDEDGTGVVGLTRDQEARWWLTVDGIGNSWLPYGSVHTLLGAVPASIHPEPDQVAVVGLGSGDTAWAASYRPETASTTVYEISYPQPRILWRFAGLMSMPELRSFLEDSRVSIRLEDGRKGLEADTTTFDLIETDATWPESAGSGNLYSLEFYEVVAERLNPGGLACTWSPTARVTRTFRTVFPHVLESRKGLLIGSLAPIPLEPEVWAERARRGEGYLGAGRTAELVDELLHLKNATGDIEGSLNRDLFPRDEFGVPSAE